LEVGERRGEVLAAGDLHRAEPVLVVGAAVVAGFREGVARCVGGVARDLREGVGEVGVVRGGLRVVEGCEACGVELCGVGGDGVGDVTAEGEVVDYLAVAV
jgi:hypothetical protein